MKKSCFLLVAMVVFFCLPLAVHADLFDSASYSIVNQGGTYYLTISNVNIGGTPYWVKWNLNLSTAGWDIADYGEIPVATHYATITDTKGNITTFDSLNALYYAKGQWSNGVPNASAKSLLLSLFVKNGNNTVEQKKEIAFTNIVALVIDEWLSYRWVPSRLHIIKKDGNTIYLSWASATQPNSFTEKDSAGNIVSSFSIDSFYFIDGSYKGEYLYLDSFKGTGITKSGVSGDILIPFDENFSSLKFQ